MSTFLEVAHMVLCEIGHPLSVSEITRIGLERGWLKTDGITPWQTMKSKLSTDILVNKEQSCFMRTEEGRFGLREWLDRFKEYIAVRYEKSLLQEDVVVFPSTSLYNYIPGPGLHTRTLDNGRELLAECRSMPRHFAEEDFTVIKLVSVFVLKLGSRYLTYKRTKRLPETRLHGYYSLIFGGHLNPDETLHLFDIFQPDAGGTFLRRELEEEVILPEEAPSTIVYKGLLYDDSRRVSSQHLGIAYDVILNNENLRIGERGFLMDPKFETLVEIEARLLDFENWSAMIVKFERETAQNKAV